MHRLCFLAAPLLTAALCAAPISAARASVIIAVDKAAQQMTVTVDGEPRWTWPVSTGRLGYATPSGLFSAFRMEKDHFSKEWDQAPMPYAIFFTDSGHAIHGSFETKNLGRRASHGCVRLSPKNAAKLFVLVRERGLTNTKVVVSSGDPIVARRVPRIEPGMTGMPDANAATGSYAYAPGSAGGYGLAQSHSPKRAGDDREPASYGQPYYLPQGNY